MQSVDPTTRQPLITSCQSLSRKAGGSAPGPTGRAQNNSKRALFITLLGSTGHLPLTVSPTSHSEPSTTQHMSANLPMACRGTRLTATWRSRALFSVLLPVVGRGVLGKILSGSRSWSPPVDRRWPWELAWELVFDHSSEEDRLAAATTTMALCP
ncbi:hypothetical protein CCM_00638 [Cordyceps militaris CM01]|uniref:Uncharacterized protein n=1 Tax=Cordyceps militaris (strain CM01) TaxID=983644 RepID=G3J570_CORMM|nr:uncharacterized protein CCM_00638 [Cordyceps militaris CM01]EGX95984.1 hypothetical protein CCM_00638 [Cordyceps militaris CM01]